MEEAVDPVELALARRPIAEDGMDMAVDQPGGERRALGVDDRGRLLAVDVLRLADGGDLAVDGDDGIGVENGIIEIAREQKPDIADHQLAGAGTDGLCFSHVRCSLERYSIGDDGRG
jgi:hypothetical protein